MKTTQMIKEAEELLYQMKARHKSFNIDIGKLKAKAEELETQMWQLEKNIDKWKQADASR